MSKGTFLFVALVAGAGALFATKPTPAEIDGKIHDLVKSEITNMKVGGDNAIAGLMQLGCKMEADDCAALLRQGMDVKIKDMMLFQRVSINGPSGALECLGILNQLYCPGFLNQDARNSE